MWSSSMLYVVSRSGVNSSAAILEGAEQIEQIVTAERKDKDGHGSGTWPRSPFGVGSYPAPFGRPSSPLIPAGDDETSCCGGPRPFWPGPGAERAGVFSLNFLYFLAVGPRHRRLSTASLFFPCGARTGR